MKLALVIPWFGRDVKGGAEQQAWQIAARLAARSHDIDVLTTCCRSHQDDWETNHLPEGITDEPEGFRIRRFKVDQRNRGEFDRVNAKLLGIPNNGLRIGVSPVDPPDAEIFVNELIRSHALLDYVSKRQNRYDWFLMLPYLYGPVLEALSIVPQERAALQPCLHNEAYAYLPQVAQAFYRTAKLLFNSEGEMALALRLFGPGIWPKSFVVGEGVEIEPTPPTKAKRSANAGQVREKFVLYLGRKDGPKNVPMLVQAFRHFREVRPNSELKLFLAGHGSVDLGGCDSITDLGVISEQKKTDLLRNCVALFQPSANESFSRAIMEAWRHGRPVAAHGSCLATALAVECSGGGWTATDEGSWAALFATINQIPDKEIEVIGRKGQKYAEQIADWDKVMGLYEEALDSATTGPPLQADVRTARQAIHQVMPNIAYGDAISNAAILIRDTFREEGYESNIYARVIDPRVAHEAVPFDLGSINESAGIIYHHSTELLTEVTHHKGPKSLIYHNITPAEFFEPYCADFARVVRTGRNQLQELASCFPISAGVSEFNVRELRDCGFKEPAVVPLVIDPKKWSFPADSALMAQLQDGRTNILYVGRIAPNKKQDDLVRAFQVYLHKDPGARLILVGAIVESNPYTAYLRETIAENRLGESVIMPGGVSHLQLAAYYWTAHLFWSMSEHEGFGVPLVEAMWFDIPVLAFKSTAIPETLGEAALMFTDKTDPAESAGLAFLLVKDTGLRKSVINAQRDRRLHFLPRVIRPILLDFAARTLSPNRPSSKFKTRK